MGSPASTPSQKQPHWRHSRLSPEHPGQPQKGRTTDTKCDKITLMHFFKHFETVYCVLF